MLRRILVPLAALVFFLIVGLGSQAQEGKVKDPDNQHALDLKVRKVGEENFGPDTKQYGVEVYQDGNTGDGIHLSEIGAVSLVPAKLFKSSDGKGAKAALWQHGLLLGARPAGETNPDKAKDYAIEVFKDENNGELIYITSAGHIAVVPAAYAQDTVLEKGRPKKPTFLHGHDIACRKAGEDKFDKETKKYGVEVYRDENNGNLLYLTERGTIAVVPGKLAGKEAGKGKTSLYGLDMEVRKAGVKDFTKDTKRFGVEVYRDEYNGNLIYMAETGTISVVPGRYAAPYKEPAKGVTRRFAMDLASRKAGDKAFKKDTTKYGIEVYRDENNGNLIYICQTGELGVVPAKVE